MYLKCDNLEEQKCEINKDLTSALRLWATFLRKVTSEQVLQRQLPIWQEKHLVDGRGIRQSEHLGLSLQVPPAVCI